MAKTGRLKQGDLGGKGAPTQLCCVHQEPPKWTQTSLQLHPSAAAWRVSQASCLHSLGGAQATTCRDIEAGPLPLRVC